MAVCLRGASLHLPSMLPSARPARPPPRFSVSSSSSSPPSRLLIRQRRARQSICNTTPRFAYLPQFLTRAVSRTRIYSSGPGHTNIFSSDSWHDIVRRNNDLARTGQYDNQNQLKQTLCVCVSTLYLRSRFFSFSVVLSRC